MTHTASAHTASAHTTTAPLRVTLLVGSNRHGRFGPVVADWLLDHLRAHDDLEPEVVDVARTDLPTTLARTPEATAALAEITPKLAGADAFVVLTPEYNHSFPAGLKNVIDWHFTEWRAKPVGLVSYGGLAGGLRAVEHLRQVFAELHAVTVRDTVSFHNAGQSFGDGGRLRDPSGPDAAAKAMLDQVVWWGRALREAKEKRPYDDVRDA
ncbi:NAD(P)H-dependent oxidoreductase [Streptomyces olivaceus]|uniref:NAD(P)H-dependent oxidoreductase n=1 Tax=Streptomyces olivaceus TaxID=47716 RepID=A0ABS7W6T9_STROV|nr:MULTISPECIES: NAD(P)H-dependent oxidoreductase [Streptomyces]MBZ6091272.1 NAD(P)H-dependent oxidoreductase [Streptomyces olivaceus]MBZ6097803.1 NAD(P)H-dependent oxidoreductase [Streptomyces olivaceus]MBZ6118248.1 NAD(P)H-dependent oxidoreductase [Streptomyces olivaceus]MBZ6153680.1 NAD(P)H-dependent oxidoreductase [Streptomyces olivaceus]MBZ6195397.1 NAD(P)H-dependent oxidoreductase [Streptomyces olivaceus]